MKWIFNRKSELPSRIVLLLTVPRSGSTWLYDALRTHPSIYVHPSYSIYSALKLNGRRYPRDLSVNGGKGQKIEMQPGVWERMPSLNASAEGMVLDARGCSRDFAIEKCHPHFFNHDVNGFLVRLEALKHKAEVKVIFLVRDPRSSISSFLNYKKRKKDWNRHIENENVPAHMARIYQSLYEVASRSDGVMIDYSRLIEDFSSTMKGVLQHIWPVERPEERPFDEEHVRQMALATRRENVLARHAGFLGSRPGKVEGGEEYHGRIFENESGAMEECDRYYQYSLKLKSGS